MKASGDISSSGECQPPLATIVHTPSFCFALLSCTLSIESFDGVVRMGPGYGVAYTPLIALEFSGA